MNNLIKYPLPDWLSIAFSISITLPFILIICFVYKQGLLINNKKVYLYTILFYLAYLIYIGFASYNGLFSITALPPRVLLFTTFPYALILFSLVLNANPIKNIIHQASIQSLVALHIFRVVGVFFILLAFYNSLPKTFAFIAGFGDIITALSSIYIFKAIQQKKHYAKKITLIWNFFGTIDILFTAVAANVLTKLSIDNGTMGVDTLARFPYCIIPAFAPPTILLLHYLIFKKIKTIKT